MSRRALRKIHEVDLSRHLHTLEALTCPLNPAELFGRRAPLEVEIGSGKGMFLLRAGQAQPETNFLGCELAKKYAHYAASRAARHGLANVVVVQGDARRLLAEFLPDASAAAVHVYFPDPWWKKRHKKRRVVNETFLRHVQRVLQPGGVLHFWSDVEEYFQATLQMVHEHTSLRGPFPTPEQAAAHDLDYQTNFERRMRLQGKPIHRARFEKPPPDEARLG